MRTDAKMGSKCNEELIIKRLIAYNGRLYAIGGLVGKSVTNNIVEVFDMQAQVWQPGTNMDVARCLHGVAVVERLFFVPTELVFEANESLNEDRLQNTDCDVSLVIGGYKFPAHRVVLMARVKHFQNILLAHTENEISVIHLDPKIIDSTYFDEILKYIYTFKITFTTEKIQSIYKAAEYLCFDELIYKVQEHLEFTVNIDNVRSYQKLAAELGLESLQAVFAQFVIQQIFSDINKVSRRRLISTLSLVPFGKTLQKLEENGRIEDMFYYTVDWILHDEFHRTRRFSKLLKNISLQKLSINFLIEVVSQNSLIRNDIDCLNLLLDAVITVPTSRIETKNNILYAFGGNNGEVLSSVSKYMYCNSTTPQWTTTPTPMPGPFSHFGCAVIGHKIYVCGGHNGCRLVNSLTVFDTLTGTWASLTPMKHARQLCGVAVLNGHIYVAGGFNHRDHQLAVVERYDLKTDRWEEVAPMTFSRYGIQLVALNGFLYAIGGIDDYFIEEEAFEKEDATVLFGRLIWLCIRYFYATGRNIWNRFDTLKTVERYNPQTDQWTEVSKTNNLHSFCDGAVLDDNIYIVGDDTCEVYNSTFKRWIEMPAPSECDKCRRLTVFNGKLYAIGADIGNGRKGSKIVEVYDFEARAWKPEPDMDVARCYHGVAVVKN